MQIALPAPVKQILTSLSGAGYAAYVVGGCVRDAVMGRVPNDWDICTSATPVQMRQSLKNYRLLETGVQHGTLTVLSEHALYEVTTFRVDGAYTDHRRPDTVRFVSQLSDDLARRDFTINAMAYHDTEGLIDLFGGCGDIEQGLIRCVGDPNERFREDGLRILRALRFASRFGFTLEVQTASAVHFNRALLDSIAFERIRAELDGFLLGEGTEPLLVEYADVFAVFLPELLPAVGFEQHNPHHFLDVWRHTARAVKSACADPVVRLALLLHDLGKPAVFSRGADGVGHFYGHASESVRIAETVLTRLRYDRHTAEDVTALVRFHDAAIIADAPNVLHWLNRIGVVQLRRLIEMKRADARAQRFTEEKLAEANRLETALNEVLLERACFQLKDLAVNGRDVASLGATDGKMIGSMLSGALNAVMDRRVPNEKAALLRFLTDEYLGNGRCGDGGTTAADIADPETHRF